ncbi:molybdopterin-dependent oxidoreductase [Sedimentimonas flavescens]|uniref:Molybdopterin-dependent oxidoreductase n=1 Tax=Sedimentimonas flavescens TaxID=2851012 RepID=A0ABT3A1A3_9RHOB|nr:nitrate reductase [Sedimentimonas flavescens]MCV2879773.1 molybdopterin-dependent oxidoreductase [Sedimentimonas flavescens]
MNIRPARINPTSMTRSTCPYCGVGCGVLIGRDESGTVVVKGDPDHPANFGRLCSKGTALAETISLDDRLLAPRINGREAEWDEALDLVAERFSEVIANHGPDAVAFYVSGQLLTEDYYVANKLMKGFIGSANIDTNSRLCMASSVAGHRRAFGTDTVPGLYEDLEEADLVVLTGSNLAWCHPVLYQRLVAAKAARPAMKFVVIDPRRTATCDIADLHLPIASGGDGALFNALLAEIDRQGAVDRAYLDHVNGFDEALSAARASDPARSGLSDEQIAAFCDLWIGTEKVVTVYSQGINQSSSGSDKVNAILNCHLATGRIGKAGMGPFSVTGQPNAMGGREVGGLANMLACHMDIENPAHRAAVQGFWQAPTIADKPGLKAVDMFRAVAEGKIKAIWIIHTNPVVSMPDADAVRAALEGCDVVVVSDVTDRTDTAKLGHVLLPATAWAEKEGTVTNSDRTISRQRRVLPAPGQARHDWRILADVACRMGWDAEFSWTLTSEVFAEYAALSGVAGAQGVDFDISDLAGITPSEYAALAPFTWPQGPAKKGGRFFAEGQFHTPDGKARMLPIVPRAPQSAPSADYPYRLNTGRTRDQWHTMTRTAKSARLNQHLGEPYLEIHPLDADALGLGPADLVEVTSPEGRAVLRVLLSDAVRPGEVFAPMHWTAETASAARIDALVKAVTDPVSGQPESKASVVALKRFAASWYGFAVSGQDEPAPDAPYWTRLRSSSGWRMELAGTEAPEDWVAYARTLFNLPQAEAATVLDPARGGARIAFHNDGRLLAALFVGREPIALARTHIVARVGAENAASVLAGRPGADAPDPGPTICACLNVGLNQIREAIETGRALTVPALGEALGAGTSCGSCRPELAALITRFRLPEAAE